MDLAQEITMIVDDPDLDILKDMDRFLLRVLRKSNGDTNIPSSIGGNIYGLPVGLRIFCRISLSRA